MSGTLAGRIREEGYVFHRLRASSCESLREALEVEGKSSLFC